MSTAPPSVTVVAPAKLTLSLRITGVRPDGYHLIDAEMVSLDLADTVTITPLDAIAPAGGPASTGSPGDGAPAAPPSAALPPIELRWEPPASERPGLGVDPGEDNLVAKALRLLGRAAHVSLVKRIPAGAGLGGGSADAAAVLRWGGLVDLAAAAGIGADVAFCLAGGRARVRGIGEVVAPLEHREERYTLLTPPFGCSTVAVYRAWDRLGGPRGEHGNDLEPAALVVEPSLAAYRDELGGATGEVPRLAGSGSTWFVPGAHPGPGRLVVTTVAATPAPA